MAELRPLTKRQQDFADDFIITLNATKSYMKIYQVKTEKVARTNGARTLAIAGVASYIEGKRKILQEKTDINQEYVIKNLVEIAERCMTHKPVMEFDYIEKEMRQKTALDEDGKEVGVYDFNAKDANRSLELIGKHIGVFKEKVELTGADGGAIKTDNTIHIHIGSDEFES
jgi:phage terminase small subunit